MKNKFKISFSKVFYYVVLIGFLFPRGYYSINESYHKICTLFNWVAVLLVVVQLLFQKKWTFNKDAIKISIYFILAIFITFIDRKDVTSGFQQMFAAPFFCVFIIINMQKDTEELLDVFNNIFCILFTINIFMSRNYLQGVYHIVFLGHVQTISQLGDAALLTSSLYWMLYKKKKKKIGYLVAITFIMMFTTAASSAILSGVVLLTVYITYRWKLYRMFSFNSQIYVYALLFLSLFLIMAVEINSGIISKINFNGREFIWQNALAKIKDHPLLGYGVDGVLLHTFWTYDYGFNYAHNQLAQNMLDGGVILTIGFWNMILVFASKINYLKEKKYIVLCNAVLLVLLIIMLFDSTTLYVYMYIVLAIIYSLPSALNNISERNEDSNGHLY